MKYLFNLLSVVGVLMFSSCDGNMSVSDGASYDGSGAGKGGSMARFTIKGDRLYTVSSNSLKVFDISKSDHMVQKFNQEIFWDVETIFPYDHYLFLGTMSGMVIMDIANPDMPVKKANYKHIVSCDPVVVHGKYAYVTLHSETGNWCSQTVNELQVIDMSKVISTPDINVEPEKRYKMNKPLGLGVTDDYLFVCDGLLKVYDRKDPVNLNLVQSFNIPDPYDVIPLGNILMVIGPKGYYQYYFDGEGVQALSQLPILFSN